MRTTKNFPANYSVVADVELPSSGGLVVNFKYGSPAGAIVGVDGPLMRIETSIGPPWLACFSKGYKGGGVVDAVMTTPNPDIVCVVCEGAGYWIHTLSRTKDDVATFPVRQVEMANEYLIFVDFTKVAVYSRSGMAWVSPSLVSDRLVVEKKGLDHGVVVCRGLNAADGGQLEINLDIHTGHVLKSQ